MNQTIGPEVTEAKVLIFLNISSASFTLSRNLAYNPIPFKKSNSSIMETKSKNMAAVKAMPAAVVLSDRNSQAPIIKKTNENSTHINQTKKLVSGFFGKNLLIIRDTRKEAATGIQHIH